MITLNISPVVFDKEEHTYTLDGKQLHGITGMLSRQLFSNKYSGIPQHILDAAAKRGTEIHEDCEAYDNGEAPKTQEGENYARLREEFMVIANEYTVSDNEYFASNIDCVWFNGEEVILADIKTTSHLDEDYLSWQLSIYAYLFELQNPDLKVSKLYAVWLRGDIAKLVEVKRKDDDAVVALMNCERCGESYLVPVEDEKALITHSAVDILIEAKQMAEYYTNRYKEIEEALLKAMADSGTKSWQTDRLKATYTPASTSDRFDSKKFQEENPELYKKYLTPSPRKETVRITIK